MARHRWLAASALIGILAVPAPASAQDSLFRVTQQSAAPLRMATMTDGQRWARAAFLQDAYIAAGIAYARAHGESAEDYGHFAAKLFGPSWGAPNGGDPIRMFRGVFLNSAAYPGLAVEVLEARDTLIRWRMNLAAASSFDAPNGLAGVSCDEFEAFWRTTFGDVARTLGLTLEMRRDGDAAMATLHGRGTAARPAFVAGTYTTSFTAAELPQAPQLAGAWEVGFAPDGAFSLVHDGRRVAQGRYEIASFDQLTLSGERGELACAPGTFRWTINPDGTLTLGRVANACEPRSLVFARKRLAPKR